MCQATGKTTSDDFQRSVGPFDVPAEAFAGVMPSITCAGVAHLRVSSAVSIGLSDDHPPNDLTINSPLRSKPVNERSPDSDS